MPDTARCPVCLSYGYCYLPDRCPSKAASLAAEATKPVGPVSVDRGEP